MEGEASQDYHMSNPKGGRNKVWKLATWVPKLVVLGKDRHGSRKLCWILSDEVRECFGEGRFWKRETEDGWYL